MAVVGVAGFSRLIGGWMIPSRQAHDVLGGHRQVLGQFGAVPRRVGVGPGGVHRPVARRPATCSRAEFQSFRGTLGVGGQLCQPGDPEAKGLVERANGYLETSFLPGRRFEGVADFNGQLTAWLRHERTSASMPPRSAGRPRRSSKTAGRCWRSRRCCPTRRCGFSVRLPRDHYVRVDTCDYSVNPRFVGRRVDVRVTLDEVVATCAGVEVARHARCLAAHQTLTLPEHGQIARTMRVEHAVTDMFTAAVVEQRDLAVYDRAIGLA